MREYSQDLLFLAIDSVVMEMRVRDFELLQPGDLKQKAIFRLDAIAEQIAEELDLGSSDYVINPDDITEEAIKAELERQSY